MNKIDLIGSFMEISSTELIREHKSIFIEASFIDLNKVSRRAHELYSVINIAAF